METYLIFEQKTKLDTRLICEQLVPEMFYKRQIGSFTKRGTAL